MFFLRPLPGPIRRLSILAVAAAVAVAAVWFAARHEIADRLVRLGISGTPLAGAAYTVTEVETGRMVLTGVSVPGAGAVGRVELSFRPWRLLDGRVESVRLAGVDLAIRFDGDGVPASPLAGLLNRRDDGNGLREPLPFAALVIEDAEIALVHPLDTIRARLDAALESTGASVSGSGRWRVDGAFGHVSGVLSLEPDPVSGRDRVVVSLAEAEVAAGGPDLGGLTAEGSWDGRSFVADIGFGVEEAPLSAAVSIVSGMAGDRLRVAATGAFAVRDSMTPPMVDSLDLHGPASLDVSFEAFVPPDRPLDLHAIALTGRIDLETGAMSLSDRFSVEASALSFDIAADGRRLRLTARPGGAILGARLPPPEAAGGIVAAALDRPFDLTLPPEGIVADATVSGESIAIAAALDASLRSGGDLDGRLSIRGDAELTPDGALAAFDVSALEFAASGALAPRSATGAIRVAGGIAGAPAAFDGAASLRARLDTLSAAGADATAIVLDLPLRIGHADGATRAEADPVALFQADTVTVLDTAATGVLAELPLDFELVDNGLNVRLADTAWIDIRTLRHPRLRSHRATSVKLEAELLPLLVLERFGEDWSWDARLLTGPAGVRFDVIEDGGTIAAVDGTLPSMGVRFGSLGRHHLQGTVETEGGDILVEGPDLRLADIRLLFTYNNGLSDWPQATADIRVIEDLREPARFAPLAADVAVMPVWPLGDDVRFNGTLHMGDRRFLANVESSYRPSDDLFRALIRVPPIRFEPGGSQPNEVSPLYGGLLEEVSGAVELHGKIAIDDGVASSDLTLSLLGLSGRNGGVAIEGLEGEVTFSNVDPLSTPPKQTLAAERLDAGLPLTDLAVTLALPGDGSLRVDAASAGLAGGRIAARPSVLRLAPDGNEALLDIQGVDLATLLDDLDVPWIETDARLTGSIPVRMTGGDIVIAHGRLDADSAGLLRYIPDGRPAPFGPMDENMEQVLDVLSDFRFSALAIDIDRAAGGAAELGVHIAGANPGFHDGYPIELNVNLAGDLDEILLHGLGAWRLPEEIRERLSVF